MKEQEIINYYQHKALKKKKKITLLNRCLDLLPGTFVFKWKKKKIYPYQSRDLLGFLTCSADMIFAVKLSGVKTKTSYMHIIRSNMIFLTATQISFRAGSHCCLLITQQLDLRMRNHSITCCKSGSNSFNIRKSKIVPNVLAAVLNCQAEIFFSG